MLRLFCKPEYLEEIEGDLLERFESNPSFWKFTIEIIKLIRLNLIKDFGGTFRMNRYGMFKNQMRSSIRFIKREKAFTLMNVTGMSVAITCSFFILIWLADELKYNAHLESEDRVCNVLSSEKQANGEVKTYRTSTFALKAVLDENYPIIESSTVLSRGNWMAFQVGENLVEWAGVDATPEVFDLFEIDFLKGDFEEMFENSNALAISETVAEVYFGKDWINLNVVGTFMENDQGETFKLVGVYEDMPRRSTVQFDFVVPFSHFLKKRPFVKRWKNNTSKIFIKLKENISIAEASFNLKEVINDHRIGKFQNSREVFLQPYEDMFLYNKYENGKITGGRIDYVRLLSVTAILILILASINFMNLTTARATKRARETGVRKVLGASKGSIRIQFQMESILITFLSVCLALILVILLFSQFEQLTKKEFDISWYSPNSILFIIIFILIQGSLAGIYPSFFLSSFKSISLLKPGNMLPSKQNNFRNALVVFQFVTTFVMIIGALTVYQQVSYIQHKNIGLNRSNLIRTYTYDMDPLQEYKDYKEHLLSKPGIENVTMVDQLLIDVKHATSSVIWEGKGPWEKVEFRYMQVNPDFIPTMEIEMKEGRNFDWQLQSDTSNYIINETAQELMGLTDPIGKKIGFTHHHGKIVGVMKDFHNASLHSAIEPMIIRNRMQDSWMILARSKPGMQKEAITSLEEAFRTYNNPDRAFWFRFVDDIFNAKYQSELLVKKLSFYFTIVSIGISLLGLISLVAYNVERKTKEVGIRKILGASILSIFKLLSADYIRLLMVATIIAYPIAYFIMSDWLDGFAYRISLDWRSFAFSGFCVLFLALMIVGLLTKKVANANPVNSLRDE
ncbi:MAG: FtsX-like permease family protein [Bacteroidota bacterium]